MVQINFNVTAVTKNNKAGRKKGCKLTYKVNRTNCNQARYGHRNVTTSANKLKDTPVKQGYHLEDYNRRVVYEHYYDTEEFPFYVGTGTLGRAFYLKGPRRNDGYNTKVKDVNLVKVKIVAIDINKKDAISMEMELCNKYKLISDGGTLVNNIYGGRGGNNGITSNKAIYQIDVYGKIIKEFSSIREACNILNLDPSYVTKICKGTKKSTKGYRFKYKE